MTELLEEQEDEIREATKLRLAEEEARRQRLVAKVKFSTKIINPFDALDIDPVRDRGWDNGKVLSQPQRELLMKQNIDPDTMNYAAAKAVLNELFRRWKSNLCSLAQANLLKKHGFDPREISRPEAKRLIDAIAKNGWKRPAQLEASVPKLGHNGEENPFNE